MVATNPNSKVDAHNSERKRVYTTEKRVTKMGRNRAGKMEIQKTRKQFGNKDFLLPLCYQ